MKTYIFTLLFLLCLCPLGYAQQMLDVEKTPLKYASPLQVPLILAGNFGELRSDHFHAGIDIKTQHREGLSVKAIADGYVSRIKISLWGYGKALYVKHPDGKTSVYAHLQKFSPVIEQYVHEEQYKKKSYTLELFPKENSLLVGKGSLIAYSGDTGGSTAPHLHFEMRKSGTAIAINPLQFPYNVADQTPPQLQKIFAYPTENKAHINQSENKVQLTFKRVKEGHYTANPIFVNGAFSFGVKAYDRQDLAANKNGVYQYKLYAGDTLLSHLKFDAFSFYETRYINTLIDYEHLIKSRERIVLLFKKPNNPLSVFKHTKNQGSLTLAPGEERTIKIVLQDLNKNSTTVYIPVKSTKKPALIKKTISKTPYPIYHQKPSHFKFEHSSVYIPAKSFYEDHYLEIEEKEDTIRIHNTRVPLHKSFTLSFKPKEKGFTEKDFIGYRSTEKEIDYQETKNENGWLTTTSKKLGTYIIGHDSVPPSIKPKNFKPHQNIKNYKFLSFTIKDTHTGIKSYKAYLNQQWILMEYEPKNNSITHHLNGFVPLGKTNTLCVSVTDQVGNTSTYSTTLTQ